MLNPKKSLGLASSSSITTPIMATGVSLSERFKVLSDSKKEHLPVLNQGGFGYGAPFAEKNSSVFFPPPSKEARVGLGNHFLNSNKALAAALLAKQTNELLRRSRLMDRRETIAELLGQRKQPISMRVGHPRKAVHKISFANGGGVTKKSGARGAFNNVGRGGSSSMQKGGVVVARGGGGAPKRGGRGKGISPLNRSNVKNGGAGKNWYGAVKSKTDLDSELDQYMSKAKNRQKGNLDEELEEYMKARKAQSSATASSIAVEMTESERPITPIAVAEDDVVMSDDEDSDALVVVT